MEEGPHCNFWNRINGKGVSEAYELPCVELGDAERSNPPPAVRCPRLNLFLQQVLGEENKYPW